MEGRQAGSWCVGVSGSMCSAGRACAVNFDYGVHQAACCDLLPARWLLCSTTVAALLIASSTTSCQLLTALPAWAGVCVEGGGSTRAVLLHVAVAAASVERSTALSLFGVLTHVVECTAERLLFPFTAAS